jgi:short-subunit dehydrogenase
LLAGEKKYPMLMDAPIVALDIVNAIEKKKRIAIIDWKYRLLVFFWRLIPKWIWLRLPIRN